MNKHRETLINIKSDLLSLYISKQNTLTVYDDFAYLLQRSLKKYFDIEKCCFLLFEGESIKLNRVISSISINSDQIMWDNLDIYFGQNRLVDISHNPMNQPNLKDFSHILFLKANYPNKHAVLYIKSTSLWHSFSKSEYFNELIEIFSNSLNVLSKNIEIQQNEKQYRKLYNVSDLFYSTMDIDLILENVLITIQENFPHFGVELILSNDYDRQTKIQIKPFDYLTERPAAIEAFVSGKLTIENDYEINKSLLNAPIKGKQGIYGILQVSTDYSYHYSISQQEFIRMLANASGNAIENAKLYHQSHRLISDLQLINETSHRLNMKLDKIDEMFLFLQKQLMKSFQPLELCFVFIENENLNLTKASTNLFKSEKGLLYVRHVAKHFKKSQEPLFIADLSRLLGEEIEYKSIMAIPMIVEQKVSGFSIVLHRDSYFFSFDSFKLMQSLIHHSSLAITNSLLRNQLQQLVDQDHLTKLYARSFLDKFVEDSLANDRSGMFLLIDIDNFKKVNDTFGHQIGDEILIQIGDELRKIIGTRGICARWGGEELAVYVPNMLEEDALLLAKKIVQSIPEVTNPQVTVSAGLINWIANERPEFQSIFLHADTALYHAKGNGKNQVCLYEKSMTIQS